MPSDLSSRREGDSALVFGQGGSNAIYWASRHGHVDTLKFLNENKCPLDVKDKVRPLLLQKGMKGCMGVLACHGQHDPKNEDSGPESSCREFNLEDSQEFPLCCSRNEPD